MTTSLHAPVHVPVPDPLPSIQEQQQLENNHNDEAVVIVFELIKHTSTLLTSIKLPPLSVENDSLSFKISSLQLSSLQCTEDKIKIVDVDDSNSNSNSNSFSFSNSKIAKNKVLYIKGASAEFQEFEWAYTKKGFPALKDHGSGTGTITGINLTLSILGIKPAPSPHNKCTIDHIGNNLNLNLKFSCFFFCCVFVWWE